MSNDLCDPARFDLFRGDSKIVHIRVKDSNGDDVEVDDATVARFGFFDPVSKESIFLLTLADDPVTITLAGAVMTVTIPAASTEELLGRYLFEADLIDVNGLKHTVIQGEVTVKEDLIRV